MPRRYYDDDDDLPRRTRRRRFDDDFDDRPRARSRYDDDDDDFVPPRRRTQDSGAMPMIIVGIVIGAVILLGGLGGLVYLMKPRAVGPPPQQNFAAQPAQQPPAPVFIPPGVPREVVPPELASECVISNLRLTNNGLGRRPALTFDYEFPGGRPFGGERYVAVVTEPGKQPTTANLLGFMAAKDSVSIEHFGGFGTFPSGTTVYIGKGFPAGPNAQPKRISNILTLP